MRTADVEDVNLVALAMAMAVQFTGVIVEPDRDVVDPQIFYPITEPVLRLPVTPDELARGGLPNRAKVRAVQGADETSRWRLAEWSVRTAAQRAGLSREPAIQGLFAQFGRAKPSALSVGLAQLRNQASQELNRAA